MKKLFYVATLLLSLMVFASCSKEDSPSGDSWYIGKWSCELIVGQGDLSDITSVTITKKDITMTFKQGGRYGYLYDEYGPSHTVKYTYKENDVTFDDEEMASLTFDEPLYFANYESVGDVYVSKVFIDTVSPNKYEQIEMSDEHLSHGFLLSK